MRGTFLRWLNLVLAPLQIVVTVLAFARGTSFDQATADASGDPPIVPAGYAFIIWSVIYAGSVLYGIYQFGRNRPSDALLDRLRPFTASAFAATVCWLIAARFNETGATVICIFWLLASLLPAFISLVSSPQRFTWTEHISVTGPLSIYTGWVTLAVFANTSVWLYRRGLLDLGLNPAQWSVVMLVIAGTISAWLVKKSSSVPFALTVCWGLIAILIANLTREYHPEVVAVCAAMTAAQFGVLVWSRSRI